MSEVELKLGFPAAARRAVERHPALREARVGRGSRRTLHSVYFDTPDQRLRQAGTALRIRRDGNRWVQTWKSGGTAVGGLHTRDEIEWEVPDAALVAGHLTERLASFDPMLPASRLRPAFTTRFERYSFDVALPGGGLAEISIDHGVVEARGRAEAIDEIEIELKEGDAAGLFDLGMRLAADLPLTATLASKAERGYSLGRRVVRAPIRAARVALERDATTLAAACRIVASCIEQMQANEYGVLHRADPEFLHQFRVGMRRLKAALGAFSALAPPGLLASLRDELRWLDEAVGPARDWDVWAVETVPVLRAAFPDHAGLARLASTSGVPRRAARTTARDALRSSRYTRLLLVAGQLAAALHSNEAGDEPPVPLVRDYGARLLARRWARLRKRDPVEASTADRHRTRIAAKKLRYAVEFFGPAFGKRDARRARRFARSLASLQDSLGTLNDVAVAEALIHRLAAAPRAPDEATVALVRGWIAGFGRGGLGGLRAAWRTALDAERFW